MGSGAKSYMTRKINKNFTEISWVIYFKRTVDKHKIQQSFS